MASNEGGKPQDGEGKGRDNKVDMPFEDALDGPSDCYLVCEGSDRKLPSSTSVLSQSSKLLRAYLHGYMESRSSIPQTSRGPVEIKIAGGTEEAVQLLWEFWHGKRQLIDVISNVMVPDMKPQTLKRISSVAKLADMYRSEGLLDQLESLLLRQDFFDAIAYPSGSYDFSSLFQLWSLACKHGMHRLVGKVEELLKAACRQGTDRSSFGDANALEAFAECSSGGLKCAAISLLKVISGLNAAH